MSDSEQPPAAAAPEQSDDVPAPAEAAAATVAVNGDGDVVVADDDADVPQIETRDDDDDATQNGAVDAASDDTVHTPTRQKHRPQHLALPQEGSELGSVDADSVDLTPRRTGSPPDSLVSAQGISPSIQVYIMDMDFSLCCFIC